MASPTQWTWVWANAGRQWRTGKLGMLQSMRLQRVRYNLVTKQQRWLSSCSSIIFFFLFWKGILSPLNCLCTFVKKSAGHICVGLQLGVWSLGWEDPLEKGMATHFSILAWRIHRQRSLRSYSPWGCKESDRTELLTHTHRLVHSLLLLNSIPLYG